MNAQFFEDSADRDAGGNHGAFCAALHFASSHGPAYLDTLTQLLQSPTVDISIVDSQGSLSQDKLAFFVAT